MKKLTQEELDKILKQHEKWLRGDIYSEPANLSYTDLSGLDFRKAYLITINMSGSCLIGANMRYAMLDGVILLGSNLSNADLYNAVLKRSVLDNANLTNANLRSVTFDDVSLKNTNFKNAKLKLVNFENIDTENIFGLPTQEEFLDQLFEKTEKGYIVYKVFGLVYKPPIYWDVKRGSIIEEKVNLNRNIMCLYGINVATKEWIQSFQGYHDQPIWKCLLSFEDLDKVCVPYATDGKIRCGRLKLLEVVE